MLTFFCLGFFATAFSARFKVAQRTASRSGWSESSGIAPEQILEDFPHLPSKPWSVALDVQSRVC